MSKKQKKQDDLDMETTFADMNVEGFSWYNPNKKALPEDMKLTRVAHSFDDVVDFIMNGDK